MKLWIIAITSIIIFSGCNSRTQTIKLQNTNAKQALIIQQQQAQIAALTKKATIKKSIKKKKKKSTKKTSTIPVPPKKNIKLKKVEDNNYTSGYMYPGQSKKKPIKLAKVVAVSPTAAPSSASSNMGKAECIAMIGTDKFAKYTQMFGSEAASIKRCKMLKAMK